MLQNLTLGKMPTTVTNLVFPLVPINPITQGGKASTIFLRFLSAKTQQYSPA
jgi:hypothetical protein